MADTASSEASVGAGDTRGRTMATQVRDTTSTEQENVPPRFTLAENAARGKSVLAPERQAVLDKLTNERNCVLDRWADAGTLGLNPDEVALNVYQRNHLKFLFGETGFNPPVPARNPVSVNMHNPRFSAALWAVNTEAYRRKGSVSP